DLDVFRQRQLRQVVFKVGVWHEHDPASALHCHLLKLGRCQQIDPTMQEFRLEELRVEAPPKTVSNRGPCEELTPGRHDRNNPTLVGAMGCSLLREYVMSRQSRQRDLSGTELIGRMIAGD